MREEKKERRRGRRRGRGEGEGEEGEKKRERRGRGEGEEREKGKWERRREKERKEEERNNDHAIFLIDGGKGGDAGDGVVGDGAGLISFQLERSGEHFDIEFATRGFDWHLLQCDNATHR